MTFFHSITLASTKRDGSCTLIRGLPAVALLRSALDALVSEYFNERVVASSPEGVLHHKQVLLDIRSVEDLLGLDANDRFDPS